MDSHTFYFTRSTYKTKEDCLRYVRVIQSSMQSTQMDTRQIIALTDTGHCIKFGKDNNAWDSQSLFGIDIDNLHDITLRNLLAKLHRHKLDPFAAFTTLSNADPLCPTRLRLYFALDEVITDQKFMRTMIKHVCNVINALSVNSVDYSCTMPGHIFFPGHVIYQAPNNKICVKDHESIIQILSSDHFVVFDRNQFMRSLQESFKHGHGVSGTIFHPISDIPDPVMLGVTKKEDGTVALNFSLARAYPIIYLYLGVLPSNEEYHRDRNTIPISHLSQGDNRYIYNKYIGTSNGQKSTEDKLYYAKVNSYTFFLFQTYLCNHLSATTNCPYLKYDIIKNDEHNIQILRQLFPVKNNSIHVGDLQINIQDYHKFIQSNALEDYPSLQQILNIRKRRDILCSILAIANENLTHFYGSVAFALQHIINTAAILGTKSKNQVSELLRLFDKIGLIQIVDKEHYHAYIKPNQYHKLPIVITIPYFDEYLLASAEEKAKSFLAEHKTIRGLGSFNTDQNDNYLSVKNCVISLLDAKQYFTRTTLIKLIEAEQIPMPGHKGDYLVDRYLPTAVKELNLIKQHSKALATFLPKDKSLRYGTSVIYHRRDLYANSTSNS